MTNTEDWREKYRALARELEACEKQGLNLSEQIRSLAMQLSLAVHGQIPELDRLLGQLTSALHQGPAPAHLALLRETEKYIRSLDEARAQQAQAMLVQLREWIEFLQLWEQTPIQQTTLVTLSSKLDTEVEACHALPGMVESLLILQKQILPTASALSLTQSSLPSDQEVLAARLAEQLLKCLECLSVPTEQGARVQRLIQRLETAPSFADLEECAQELAELARLSGGGAQQEIQEYLIGLNEQLAHLQSFLASAESIEATHRQRNNLLDQTVRVDVQRIHHSVRHSESLDELKRDVKAQLVSIVKTMNERKQAEDQRYEALKKEHQTLHLRMSEMEQESAEFRKQAEAAHKQSHIDPLTHLANRFAYNVELAKEYERFQRYGTVFSLLIADIDFFKRINDNYGHLAGDKVLRLIARVLKTHLRQADFVARFGGEEFVILMPSTEAQAASRAAEKLRQAVAQSPFNFQGQPVQITLSLGVAQIQAQESPEALFERADRALYAAKHSGRNRICMSEK
ncbi:GGDEF domain-containing protein [Nitrincola tapanii]|uniref:diguanylate cyclase n=1 Tax=Nitrincola tapanii TaxID=1708751 RepID=A0A5A9W3I3_9GAMM|nr:GGDEF domain-containing protein [Nitrincola tapanii]KAA0874685.1 GGDEF domain-containing protein [Nitrincola tapanii]